MPRYKYAHIPGGAVAITRHENEEDTHGKSIAFLLPGDDVNGLLAELEHAGSVLTPEQCDGVEQDILGAYDYTV